MLRNVEGNGGSVGGTVGLNKGIGLSCQINGVFVNDISNIHENYTYNTTVKDEDDEEWYPPSPPIYDVTDKLIEINRMLYDDPTSLVRNGPGKLRWKPDSYLVQVTQKRVA